jgi:hypothetical protein
MIVSHYMTLLRVLKANRHRFLDLRLARIDPYWAIRGFMFYFALVAQAFTSAGSLNGVAKSP